MKKKQKIIRSKIKPYPETHQRGMIEVNLTDEISWQKIKNVQFGLHDLGVQIAEDGRVWICIDGVSFLRFKPSIKVTTNVKCTCEMHDRVYYGCRCGKEE